MNGLGVFWWRPCRLSQLLASALVLAIVATAPVKVYAATILIQGEIVPAATVMEQPDYALALTNDDIRYSIAHADGTADAVMTWFGVQRPDDDVVLDWALDDGSDVFNVLVAPDGLIDANHSRFLLTVAELPELSTVRYGLGPLFANGNTANVHNFLGGAMVAAGFGPLTGAGLPQTIEDAVARTNGSVLLGQYPANVQLDDAWVFRNTNPVDVPEPSTFVLVASAVAAAGLATRRRQRNKPKRSPSTL